MHVGERGCRTVGDEHRHVTYTHDYCNVSSGAIHLLASTERKILAAMDLVKCVEGDGLQKLDEAIADDDIVAAFFVYADCIGKIDNAIVVFDEFPTLYDDVLAEISREYRQRAKEMNLTLNQRIREFARILTERINCL